MSYAERKNKMIKFILMIWYKTTRNIFLFLLMLFVISVLYLLMTDRISERHNDKVALEMFNLIKSNPQEVEKMIKNLERNGVNIFSSFDDNFPNFSKNGFRYFSLSNNGNVISLKIKEHRQYRFLDKMGCGEYLVFYKNYPNYQNGQCLDDNCEDVIIRKVTDNWYWQKHCL